MKSSFIAFAILLAAAGCSSSDRGTQARDTGAANTQTTHGDRAAASAALPIYPGATKLRLPSGAQSMDLTVCGSKMRIVDYKVSGADAATIMRWYAERISGGLRVAVSFDSGSSVSIYRPDGSAAATAVQVRYDPALASAAKSIGADATTLGIVTYDPPLSHDILQSLQRYASGDAADKKAARAELKSKCPDLASMTR
jgi:hypothetical protein